ncbi:hypothetical protein EJ06DRAFT_533525 [Trichodelitschia bisporula]|uniref:Uncharacterized protein n=1 Tax=Trichodelitschia bisporula TaxID=703511 RepID=A0A6G1HLL1_9PEZI|nr:hypothetical protein EJ06DRAFT_533525 [Trichodelitschia bisporula]
MAPRSKTRSNAWIVTTPAPAPSVNDPSVGRSAGRAMGGSREMTPRPCQPGIHPAPALAIHRTLDATKCPHHHQLAAHMEVSPGSSYVVPSPTPHSHRAPALRAGPDASRRSEPHAPGPHLTGPLSFSDADLGLCCPAGGR